MPLTQMPNGEYVDVPDDIAPDALKRIQAQYSSGPQSRKDRVAAGQPRKQESDNDRVQKRADQYEKAGYGAGAQNSIMNGLTFGFADKIGAGIGALISGHSYDEERALQKELKRRYEERHPVVSTTAEIGGALLNPVGTGARGLQAAGRGAEAVATALGTGGRAASAASRVGRTLTRTGQRLENAGGVTQALTAGAVGGALNGAGNSEGITDMPGAAVRGAAMGAVTGGALGAAGHLGKRVIETVQDASKGAAERTAYSRIADLLDRGGTNARKVQREIAVTDARGGDAMVQDMLPSLRAQAAAISRKPSVTGSNELIDRGEQRIQDRRGRFGEQVREASGIPPEQVNALDHMDALKATRKAEGQAGYEDSGLMDRSITPTPEIQSYLREAPAEIQDALKGAYSALNLRDQKLGDYVGPDGVFTHIPTLRVFDQVSRQFNQRIGAAIKGGDQELAAGLSYQLDKMKGVLAKANPNDAEYQAVLAGQRDLFQKQKATELGQDVLKRIGSTPRQVMRDLQKLPEEAQKDARIGIIDSLINMDTKADPVAYFRSISRNAEQKKVLEFAFGGRGNLGRFQRWVNREVRGTRADVLTAPGRQSETSRIAMAGDDGSENVGNILSNAMRGYAFGGAIGAASGAMRTLQNIATGTSRLTQEEIAKILLSKGEGLAKGIEASRTFTRARTSANQQRARLVAKAGQQSFTDQVGGQ